jgi:hypothetical protein
VILKKDFIFSVQNEMDRGDVINQYWVRGARLKCYDDQVKSCKINFKDVQVQTCLVNQNILYIAEFSIDDDHLCTVKVRKHDFTDEKNNENLIGVINFEM